MSQKNTIASIVNRKTAASATAVPTSTTSSGAGGGAGAKNSATESTRAVIDVDSAAGRRSAAHIRTWSKNGGSEATIRWPWFTAAGTTMKAMAIATRKNAR